MAGIVGEGIRIDFKSKDCGSGAAELEVKGMRHLVRERQEPHVRPFGTNMGHRICGLVQFNSKIIRRALISGIIITL
jgi:hypothetical protein